MITSKLRRMVLVFALLSVLVPGWFAFAPSPVNAAASHENTNPYTTGCMAGAVVIGSKAVSGGTVSIMMSTKCQTNWVSYSGVTQTTTKYGKAAGKNWTNTEVDNASSSFSLQSYAPGSTAYTGVIKIGNTTTTASCGNGCTWSVSGASAAAPAATTSLDTKIANFINATKGRTIANASGGYAGECVSLVQQYLVQVWGITPGAWGNAVDYRSGGSGGNQLAARGFTWSTNQNFKNGDIIVWGQGKFTGSAGHIGIYLNGQLYDQNNSGRRTANFSGAVNTNGYLGRWSK